MNDEIKRKQEKLSQTILGVLLVFNTWLTLLGDRPCNHSKEFLRRQPRMRERPVSVELQLRSQNPVGFHYDRPHDCGVGHPQAALGTCVGVIPQVAAVTPMSTEWGYEDHNGPKCWGDSFPTACGKRQSPINIVTNQAVIDEDLELQPLSWFYSLQSCKSLLNTGAGWKVVADGDNTSVLEGGPLRQRYRLIQFHAHWGRNDNCGSEHTVDGKSYTAEVHLVHWNFDLYGSFAEAAKAPDGLAVLGAFFEIGEENPELEKLLGRLDNIQHKNKECSLDESINPAAFIPDNRAYWTYEGSLTTPPCSESVIWIIFKEPLQISSQQLKKFRELLFYTEDCECPKGEFDGMILENYRPPQPLAGRTIREASN